jgi:hypothetical protein
MHIRQNIACNGNPVALAKENDMAGRMARCVYHAKAGHIIAVSQDVINPMRRSRPQAVGQSDETALRQHGRTAFHDRYISLVTGQRNIEVLTDRMGAAEMIRMAMR